MSDDNRAFVGYDYWDETRGMQPIVGGDWYRADDVDEAITAKDKRIAELEIEIVRLSASFLKINDIVKQVFDISGGGADE